MSVNIFSNDYKQTFFLNKIYPDTESVRETLLSDIFGSISSYLNNLIQETNSINNKYLSYIDNIASFTPNAIEDISILNSLLADIYIISGASNNSFDLLNNFSIKSSRDIIVDKENFSITIEPETRSNSTTQLTSPSYDIKKVDIIPRAGFILGQDIKIGNNLEYERRQFFEPENLISDDSRFEVESIDKELFFTLQIDLGTNKIVNIIDFNIFSLSSRLPKIESIQTSSSRGVFGDPINITNIDATSIDLNDINIIKSNSDHGKVRLSIPDSFCRYIRVNFSQRNFYQIIDSIRLRYAVSINNLRTGFSVPKNNGEIIIGPFKSESEILKVGIAAEYINYDPVEKNIQLEISSAGEDNSFVPVENSGIYNAEQNKRKIINFNTIDISSVITTDPVKEIYLKLILTSKEEELNIFRYAANKESEEYINRIRQATSSLNRTISISSLGNVGEDSISVYRTTNQFFGKSAKQIQSNEFMLSSYTKDIVRDKNIYLIKSIASDLAQDHIGVATPVLNIDHITDKDRLETYSGHSRGFVYVSDKIKCLFKYNFDPYNLNCESYSPPINLRNRPLETLYVDGLYVASPRKTNEKFIINGNIKEGVYQLSIEGQPNSIAIDYSAGYITTVLDTYFIVDNSIETGTLWSLYDQVGDRVGTSIVYELNGNKFVRILDVFSMDMPEIIGKVFNSIYPLKQLENNEFTLTERGFIFGSYFKGVASYYNKIIKAEVPYSLESGLNNEDILVLDKYNPIKSEYPLTGSDFKRVVKLKHTNLVPSSVTFDASKASVSTFLNEVEYIDGDTEFNITEVITQKDNYSSNQIYLDESFNDPDQTIFFVGQVDLFSNQVYSESNLINRGDWLIDYDEVNEMWYILLPEGIFTNDSIDTEITYKIKADKSSLFGYYSINYKDGILYTTGPIDSKVIIKYLYSSVYGQFEGLKKLKKEEYKISNDGIDIKDSEQVTNNEYVIINDNFASSNETQDILVAPIVKNIKINFLTAEDFL